MAKSFQIFSVVLALLTVTSLTDGQLITPLKNGISAVTTPIQREIERSIDTLKPSISKLINVNPDTMFSTIFPTISNFNQSQIFQCYNSSIGDIQFDIFKNTVFDAVKAFYVSDQFHLIIFYNFKYFIEKLSRELWANQVSRQSKKHLQITKGSWLTHSSVPRSTFWLSTWFYALYRLCTFAHCFAQKSINIFCFLRAILSTNQCLVPNMEKLKMG